jgi:tetratricopeptide (TPR) repeat protein
MNSGETISYWYGSWGSFRTISHRNRFYLNDSPDASDSSNIRKLIDIRIPAGTQYWYYAFTTSTPEIDNSELWISGKLNNRLVEAKKNKTEPDLAGLEIPQGTDSINVYLLNTENASIFTQGSVNFNSIYEGTVKNRRQGLILVKNNNETSLSFGVIKTGLPGDLNVDFDFLFIVDSSMTETGQANTPFQQDFFDNNFFNNNFFSGSMAVTIGNQGWKAFQEGDYDQCLIFSKGALEKDNSLGFVHFNIALVYLIKGQNHKALKKYNEAIEVTLKEFSMKHDLDGAIDDLKTYMHKFPSKKTAYKILNKLTAISDKHNL